jgi:hypothetical protein
MCAASDKPEVWPSVYLLTLQGCCHQLLLELSGLPTGLEFDGACIDDLSIKMKEIADEVECMLKEKKEV